MHNPSVCLLITQSYEIKNLAWCHHSAELGKHLQKSVPDQERFQLALEVHVAKSTDSSTLVADIFKICRG